MTLDDIKSRRIDFNQMTAPSLDTLGPDLKPQKATTTDDIYVTFQGKEYRLYKQRKGGNYMLRVQRKGKDIPRTTGTPIAEIARKQAKTLLTAMFSETWEDQIDGLRHKAKPQSTVGDLIDLYEKSAADELGISEKTVSRNASQLLRMIAAARPGTDPRSLRLEEVNEDLARAYIASQKKATADREKRGEASIRSSINQARSLFTPKLKHLYSKSLRLPKKLGFELAELNLKTATNEFVPIPEPVVAAMESEAREILRVESPSAWRGYLGMSRLGMRNNEVVAVRSHWFEVHNGTRLLVLKDRPEENFKLKNNLPGAIGVSEDLWNELTEGLPEGWDYLINERTATERQDAIYRTLTAFVRKHLPDRQKAAYELRKWAGSMVATEHKNIYPAQQLLRHKSVKVTESYYATYLKTIHGVSAASFSSIYRGTEAKVENPK
jgi:hypothetical protein